MRQWWSKVARALGRRRNLASELQQEMDAHLQFLIDENLDQNFQVALLPRDRLHEFLQFLLCGLTLPNLGCQAGAQPVNVLLQQDAMLIRGQESNLQIMILVL